MQKEILAAMAAALTLATSAAIAAEPAYTFIEGGYQDVNLDKPDADGDGYTLRGSIAITPLLHLFGGYSTADLDGAAPPGGRVDYDTWELGAGLSYALTERVHFVGEASYLNAELENAGFRSDDDGYGLYAGLRSRFAMPIELEGGVKYVDIGDAGEDVLLKLGAHYFFTDQWAAGLSLDLGDDATAWGVNVRWQLPAR
jgi:opacity protein-like surface antigen